MYPIEFFEMVLESEVINEYFSRVEVYPLWNLSMMTQVDEVNSDKFLNMNFTEFIEAVCRVADKLGIPNLAEDSEALEEDYTQERFDELNKRPLCEKIDCYLLVLAKNCLPRIHFNQTV